MEQVCLELKKYIEVGPNDWSWAASKLLKLWDNKDLYSSTFEQAIANELEQMLMDIKDQFILDEYDETYDVWYDAKTCMQYTRHVTKLKKK